MSFKIQRQNAISRMRKLQLAHKYVLAIKFALTNLRKMLCVCAFRIFPHGAGLFIKRGRISTDINGAMLMESLSVTTAAYPRIY